MADDVNDLRFRLRAELLSSQDLHDDCNRIAIRVLMFDDLRPAASTVHFEIFKDRPVSRAEVASGLRKLADSIEGKA